MKALALLLVMGSFMVAASACGASTTNAAQGSVATSGCADTSHESFAKTKFAIHMGIAVGAFEHWIWKPYKAGAFKSGAPGRTKALIKAGATGLLIVHELRIACHDANSSPTLKHLLSPLRAVITQISALAAKLKSGHFNPSDITSVNGAVAAVAGG